MSLDSPISAVASSRRWIGEARLRRSAALLAGVLLTATACAPGTSGDRTLTVLAAASLTETFTELGDRFEAEHPGVDVRLVFDSSATLARLTAEGAPGDVLATADRRTMDEARTDGGLRAGDDPEQFATNVLVLAVPADDPGRVGGIRDLDRSGVDYLTCVATAPCGATARTLLRANDVTRPPASEEVDVKAVLAKVVTGDADAGLVYRTDAVAAGAEVSSVDIPGAAGEPNTYWVAVTASAHSPGLAADWVRFAVGDQGREVLAAAGFGVG